MRERIIDKMTQYIEGLLDAEEWSKHSNERFTQAMGLLMGGRS